MESVCAVKRTEGSNPSLSAKQLDMPSKIARAPPVTMATRSFKRAHYLPFTLYSISVVALLLRRYRLFFNFNRTSDCRLTLNRRSSQRGIARYPSEHDRAISLFARRLLISEGTIKAAAPFQRRDSVSRNSHSFSCPFGMSVCNGIMSTEILGALGL